MNQPGAPGVEPVVYTVQQVARLLQMSENSVYNLIAQDAIPYTRFGKLIRVPRWALLQFIEKSSGAPLPANLDVALRPNTSVDGQRPEEG